MYKTYLSIEIILTGDVIMNKQNGALLSIVSNTLLIIFKLVVGTVMGSVSVISEGIHSSIDLLASLIAFFSIKKASEAEDEEHPFGHGKYENISGFVEALLILIAAILIIFEAVKKLFASAPVENVYLGIIVMFVSSAVNLFISLNLLRISKKTNSIALEADAMHLLTDVFTSLGVFLGLIALKITGLKILDSVTAILVACLIFKTSIDLVKKSLKDLVDSSLSAEDINTILSIVKDHPEVKSYHKLRTRKSGETREIDIHLQLDSHTSLEDTHELCNEIEREIKTEFQNSYILIHAEPFNNANIN